MHNNPISIKEANYAHRIGLSWLNLKMFRRAYSLSIRLTAAATKTTSRTHLIGLTQSIATIISAAVSAENRTRTVIHNERFYPQN